MIALLLALSAVPAGSEFTCTPTRVWDGDGPIWCAEGPRIRLAGIAAREIDGTCNVGQPCPSAGAIEARDHLAGLIGTVTGQSNEGHPFRQDDLCSKLPLAFVMAHWAVGATFSQASLSRAR